MTRNDKYKALFDAVERLASVGCSVTFEKEMIGVSSSKVIITTKYGHHHLSYDGIVSAINWLNSIDPENGHGF